MSDTKLREAVGSLSFSQSLRDQMRAAQQPPQGQEMPATPPAEQEAAMQPEAPPEAMAQPVEAPAAAPAEAPAEVPKEDNKDLGSKLKEGMQGMERFFTSIGDYFKKEEERGEVSRQKEEETMKKLKGIEKSIKQIVEE